jgi:MFS family permease
MILEFDISEEELVSAVHRRARKAFKASALYRVGFVVGPLIGVLLSFYPPMICCLAPSVETLPNDNSNHAMGHAIFSILFWIWRFIFYGSICTLLWSLYWKRERSLAPPAGRWWLPRSVKEIIASRSFEGKRIVEINDDGFSHTTSNGQHRLPWRAIRNIESDESFIYVLPYSAPWYFIPKRTFSDQKQLDDYFNLLMTLWRQNQCIYAIAPPLIS